MSDFGKRTVSIEGCAVATFQAEAGSAGTHPAVTKTRCMMRTLSTSEVEQVGGGLRMSWGEMAAGAGVAALGFIATGGIGDIALGILWGAGTLGEIGTAGFGVGAAGAGGYMMGGGKF